MAKQKKLAMSGGYELGRLVDQSGGMVDEVVYPTLLQDQEARFLKNISLDEKGSVKPCAGRIERFAEPFDASNPCNGLYAYYPDNVTSRLLMGADGKLYVDTPHMVTRWAEQSDFEEQGGTRINCDTTTKPGEIRAPVAPKSTFKRGGLANYPDDYQGPFSLGVAGDGPRLVYDNLAYGKAVTTNGIINKGTLSLVTDGLCGEDHNADGQYLDINGDGTPKYVQVDLGSVQKVSKIIVWHYYKDNRTYKDTRTEVSEDGIEWETVFDSAKDGTYKELIYGNKITFDTKEIRYIRDWLNGSDINNSNHWLEVQALSPFKEGVLIERGTTNLIPVNRQKFEGWTAYSGASVMLTQNQAVPEWNTTTATRIQTSGGTSTTKYYCGILSPSIVGVSYSTQIKIKNIGTTIVNVSSNLPGSTRSINPGEIRAIKVTAAGNGASAYQVLFIANNISDSLDFMAYQPQAEEGAEGACTTFIEGTRKRESLSIPGTVLNDHHGSIGLRIKKSDANIYMRKILNAQTPRIDFQWSSAGNLSVDFGGAKINVPDPAVDTDWHTYILTYSERMVKMYFDGTLVASGEATVDLAAFTDLFIGSRYDSTAQANAVFGDLHISCKYWSDEEILAAYQSGEPLPVDEHTTAKMSFDEDELDYATIPVTNGGFVWISDKKDMAEVADKTTGKLDVEVSTPGESAVTFYTRSSADGLTWSDWETTLFDGTLQTLHNDFMQVKAVGHGTEKDKPILHEIILSYDGSPEATLLDDTFTPGGQFYFATLLSKCVITNRIDPPKVWDGNDPIEILKGSPPHGQYVATHKNYLFMANASEGPSRLYFSEVMNLESWPVLNFIDISPNDGDWITGLLPYDDYLVIAKNRSIWILVGSGPSDFEVRRVHDSIGCVAPRSLVRVVDSFGFCSTEGIYLSDISTPILISERLKETWKKLNRRRLNQIAAEYYDHKLRVDAPFGSSVVNNYRIIYDSIRKCLYLQEMTKHASCYTRYVEAGQEVLLFGHSREGQVSQADIGMSDGGNPIISEWGTKFFNFGSSAVIKKVRNLYLVVVPSGAEQEVLVYLNVNGEEVPTPLSLIIEPDKMVYKLKPRAIGVRNMRSLGYRIVQSTNDGGVRFHELIQEYLSKKVKQS